LGILAFIFIGDIDLKFSFLIIYLTSCGIRENWPVETIHLCIFSQRICEGLIFFNIWKSFTSEIFMNWTRIEFFRQPSEPGMILLIQAFTSDLTLAMNCIYIPDPEKLWVMCVWPDPLRYVVICYAKQINNSAHSKSNLASWIGSSNRIKPHPWKCGKISRNSVIQLIVSYHCQLQSLHKHTMIIWGVLIIGRWRIMKFCTTFKIYVNLIFQYNLFL
jgi:hypothetical protein